MANTVYLVANTVNLVATEHSALGGVTQYIFGG